MKRVTFYALLALGWAFQRGQAQGAKEAATVRVGDTLQVAFSMPTADQACLKPIGNLKLVVQQCGRSGLVFLRIYALKGGLTLNAISGDTVSLAPPAPVPVPPPTPVPTPTPTPVSGSHPNEPAGFSSIASASFDSLDGATMAAGSNRGEISIVVDSTSPEGSKNVGQMKFPAGFPSGIAPGGFYERSPFSPKLRQVYVSFWVKLSTNWVGNAAGANKILYQNVDEGGRGSIEFLAQGGIDGTEQTIAAMIVAENVNVSAGPGASGSPTVALVPTAVPNTTAISYKRGTWGHYEVVLTLNSAPGVADGGVKWWFNGLLIGDYTGHVDWKTSASSGFTEVYWEPTYGGAGPAVPADQYMWMKNLYISGRQ